MGNHFFRFPYCSGTLFNRCVFNMIEFYTLWFFFFILCRLHLLFPVESKYDLCFHKFTHTHLAFMPSLKHCPIFISIACSGYIFKCRLCALFQNGYIAKIEGKKKRQNLQPKISYKALNSQIFVGINLENKIAQFSWDMLRFLTSRSCIQCRPFCKKSTLVQMHFLF